MTDPCPEIEVVNGGQPTDEAIAALAEMLIEDALEQVQQQAPSKKIE